MVNNKPDINLINKQDEQLTYYNRSPKSEFISKVGCLFILFIVALLSVSIAIYQIINQ